jgi:dTDP-4-dehydrorhamnose reductase
MACERIGAKLIYVSTDWVFDGEKELGEKYREGDQAGPVNMYGRTKLEGEHIVQSSGLDWIIARAAHIYGCNQATPKGKGALRLHLEKRGGWAYNSVQFLRSGGEIRQPSNMWQTPTLASEFAEFILELHRKAARGIFHVCGNDCISRLAFARELARIFQLDLSLVKEGSVKDLSRSFGISETGLDEFRVPRNVCLDNRKLVSTSGRQPVSLVQGIGIMKLQSINLEHGLAFD